MAIYKTRWFARWARKAGLKDDALRLAVKEIQDGLSTRLIWVEMC